MCEHKALQVKKEKKKKKGEKEKERKKKKKKSPRQGSVRVYTARGSGAGLSGAVVTAWPAGLQRGPSQHSAIPSFGGSQSLASAARLELPTRPPRSRARGPGTKRKRESLGRGPLQPLKSGFQVLLASRSPSPLVPN